MTEVQVMPVGNPLEFTESLAADVLPRLTAIG